MLTGTVVVRCAGVPEIATDLKDVKAVEGQTAVLECTLVGQPTPEVTWFHDDKQLDLNEGRLSGHQEAASGKATLTVHEVALEDEGQYRCVASNPAGQASTAASLHVHSESLPRLSPLAAVGAVDVLCSCLLTSWVVC